MKQLLTNLALCWLSLSASAQITISEVDIPTNVNSQTVLQQEKYDSLYNFNCGIYRGDKLLQEYRKRIGQKLFFYGDTTYMRKVFSKKGFGLYSSSSWNKNAKRISKWGYNYAIKSDIPFTKCFKKYFDLVDVMSIGQTNYETFIMKLKPEGSSDFIYYFNQYGVHEGFWTIAGYLVKARKMYLNKRFALIQSTPGTYNNEMRLLSNNELLPPIHMGTHLFGEVRSIWKCIDVTLRKPNKPGTSEENVILILRNEDGKYNDCYIRLDKNSTLGGAIYNPYTGAKDVFLGIFVSAEDYENYTNQFFKRNKERLNKLSSLYGRDTALNIMMGKVELGYTKAMCREAWGNPNDINTSSGSWGIHEQWVYEKNGKTKYLYFENDKLTAKDE